MMEAALQEQLPSIKLMKGQKDTYGWEIKTYGKDMSKALDELKLVNDRLKKEYGQ